MNTNVPVTRPARAAGFTLIEIMVVVAIIGLLATLMAPKVMNALRRSKVTVTQAKLKGLKQPIQSYQMIHSKIPESLDELLTEDEMNMNEAYLESREDFTDAWGNEFQYERMSNTKYDLISLGADGIEGGEADEQDIHLLDQSDDGGN